ncbi:MAG: MtrB/PioB family outer membrane beta-barrel protein [Deltaproteobacteria bacterium]|nr:MtrB/PioB family outer membrane beta-barrel protein [Candidatus Anaeroferrophillacea bacterium]
MKRITIYIALALCLCLVPLMAAADETTGSVSLGLGVVDMDDSREGAGEYRTLDQGANVEFGAQVDGWQKGIKYDAEIDITDQDEYRGALDLDFRRYFRTENSYQRFMHWLENDDLVNWNTDPDFAFPATMGPADPYYTALGSKAIMCAPTAVGANVAVYQHDSWGDDLYIKREEYKSHNEFLIPGAEFIKIHADYRLEKRHGYEQGRTMNKCSGCHFFAEDRRLDERTEDFKIGATAHLGMLTVDYTFFHREFEEDAATPTNVFDTASNNGGLADQKMLWDSADGAIPYDATPDSKKDSHIVKAQFVMPFNTTLFGTYVNSTVENDTATNYNTTYDNGAYGVSDDPEYDYDRIAFRLTSAPIKNLTLSLRYTYEDLDSDEVEILYEDGAFVDSHVTGGTYLDPTLYGLHDYNEHHDGFPWERVSSLSRETDTYGADFKYRLFARTSLLLGYEYEEDDREYEALGETETNTFKVALNSRYFDKLSFRLKYQYEDIDNPFAHEGAAFADGDAIGRWLADQVAANPGTCPDLAGQYSSAGLGMPWFGYANEYFVMYNSRQATLTSEPDETHEVTLNLTYAISPKMSANFHYKYVQEDSSMHIPGVSSGFDKESHSPGVDLWFAPSDKLTFTLAYQYDTMEDEAFLSIPAYGG